MNRLSVVFVATSFGRVLHGPDVYTNNLWRSFSDRPDIDFHLVAPERLSTTVDHPKLHLVATPGGSVGFYRALVSAGFALARSLGAGTLVHLNSAHMPLPDCGGLKVIGHINDPLAAGVRIWEPTEHRKRGARRTASLLWRRHQEEKNLRRLSLVLANSEFMRSTILQQYRTADPSRVRVLYKSVDLSQFTAERPEADVAGTMRALYIGANTFAKGLDLVLEAAAEVAVPLRLTVVGPAPELVRVSYGRLIERLPASVELRLVGSLDHGAMGAAYADADVLVSPTRGEAFGVTVLEALASGCFVIGSTAGGVAEILDGSRCGILVDPASRTSVAEAIARVGRERPFDEPGFANAARAVADRFSLPVMLDRLVEIYRSVAAS